MEKMMSKQLPAYSTDPGRKRRRGDPVWNLSECVAAARRYYGDDVARKIEAAQEVFDAAMIQDDETEVIEKVIPSRVAEDIVVAHFAGARSPGESEEDFVRRGRETAHKHFREQGDTEH